MYIYYSRPVTGSLPVVSQWAGTGPESVRCWERWTGSCPVMALCGISMVYYHVLSPICFMNFTRITLSEIWVQNYRNMYELCLVTPYQLNHIPWWSHQMETFSALLAICAGNSPVIVEVPAKMPVTQSFDVNDEASDLRRHHAHNDVAVITHVFLIYFTTFY